MPVTTETFSIEFDGVAFEKHEISASALAQSLLALDGLSQTASNKLYGKGATTEVKVKGGPRAGSFVIDLVVESFNTHPVETLAAGTTVAIGLFQAIKGVIQLGKFVYGKKAEPKEDIPQKSSVLIQNDSGEVRSFNGCVVNIYNNAQTQIQLSRLTQTLDQKGAEKIVIGSPEENELVEVTKKDRQYFSKEEGVVLTDNVSEVLLDVICPMLNGNKKGWKFSEGDDGIDFSATVEDEEFLAAVKTGEIAWVSGTSILAAVRTVQTKNVRTKTERTILEVKKVLFPAQEKDNTNVDGDDTSEKCVDKK